MINESVIAPVLLNPLKHHLGFIREYINDYTERGHYQLKSDLLSIGDSVLDLYIGELQISDIAEETVLYLKEPERLEKQIFFQYLNGNNGFIQLSLSDQSEWVLRKGHDPIRYLHVHPARNSKHSIRIKASALKSVIAACIVLGNLSNMNLTDFNRVRTTFLDLSPVKHIYPATARLLKMIMKE